MTAALQLFWNPPGPVANGFYWSRAGASLIQGPVGSGKTSTCFQKALRIATQQAPSTRDGVRKVKCCTVHMTYRQLWRATIKSWWNWMPKTAGQWEGGKDGPATHAIPIELGDGTRLEFAMDFVAIGDNVVEEVLRGYEPTFFLLNEADLLPPEVFTYVATRWGRFPSMAEGGPTWKGMFGDMNAPVIGSYLHEQITEGVECFFDYHRQPGGMEPGAENLQNLPEGYYADQVAMAEKEGKSDVVIDRMVHNKFGQRRDGKPIHKDFHDAVHVAPADLKPIPGLPLKLGFDAGGTPAMTVWQRAANGQWRGLDELVSKNDENMGPRRFGKLANKLLRDRYPGFQIEAWADPSSFFGEDKQGDDKAWVQIVAAEMGIRIRPAPGNNRLTVRFAVVDLALNDRIDGHIPGVMISPRMKGLRRAWGGGYRFRKLKLAGMERYHEEPEKNEASHVAESAQYVLLGGGDYTEVMGRKRARDDGRRQTRAKDDACPEGEYAGGRSRSRKSEVRSQRIAR